MSEKEEWRRIKHRFVILFDVFCRKIFALLQKNELYLQIDILSNKKQK